MNTLHVNKLLFIESRLHYSWNTCLIQLIRWIHLISKTKIEKTRLYQHHKTTLLNWGYKYDTPILLISFFPTQLSYMDDYLDCVTDATRSECGQGAADYENKVVRLEVGPLLESVGCGKLQRLEIVFTLLHA